MEWDYFLYHLLHPGLSVLVMVVFAIVVVGFTIVVFFTTKVNRLRKTVLLWLIAYLYLILQITIFSREFGSTNSISLLPLWSIIHIQDGYSETLYEKIYNILLFIPYGMLLGLYFKKKKVAQPLLVGLCTSVAVEFLQLITRTGTCETDDVICNTLGCLMGILSVLLVLVLKCKLKQKHTSMTNEERCLFSQQSRN